MNVVIAGLSLVVVLLSGEVLGQSTQASCGPQFSWMFNSLAQSPCQVAAFLGSACAPGGNYNVPANNMGGVYSPGSPISKCDCTTVEYALYSACAACQSANFRPWASWSVNCSAAGFNNIADGVFPSSLGVPNGTAIPAWAFQKILSSNPSTFNVSEAQLTGDQPEGLPSAPGAAASSSVPPSPSNSPPASAPSSKHSNVGAIAGGVVGGVFGLFLIGGAIAYFFMRRSKKAQKEHQMDNVSTIADSSINPILSSKPYDPDDPSTFPPTPMSFGHSSKQPSMSTNTNESVKWTPYDPNSNRA